MHINTVKVFIHYTLSLINQDTLKKNCFCLLIVGSSFLGSSDLFAQNINSFNSSKHRIGFIYGIGNQNLNQWLTADKQKTRDFLSSIGLNPDKIDLGVDYVYQVHFFQLQYYWAFLQRKNWSLDVLIQPQYNLTKYRNIDQIAEETKGYELGLNAGLLFRKNVFQDKLSVYSCISLGPHYVSGTPQRQSSGFIFSDNLFVGLNIKVHQNIHLDLRPGFRHISNAGLKRPNGGVNNLIFSGGILIHL